MTDKNTNNNQSDRDSRPQSSAEIKTDFDPMTTTGELVAIRHAMLSPGDIIANKFEILGLLGEGGMGAVYKAKEFGTNNTHVAIKLISSDFAKHPHALASLKNEAEKALLLKHPNIVNVFEYGEDNHLIYYAMELLEGSLLSEFILQKPSSKSLSLDQKYQIILQIANGLAYAHDEELVHLDLKPANIFITTSLQAKIIDFGISQYIPNPNSSKSIYNKERFDPSLLGAITLPYASPQMIEVMGSHPSDDIYGLGVLTCELLTGKHPFDNKDAKTAYKKRMKPKLEKVPTSELKEFLKSSLDFDRQHRIQNGGEFFSRLNLAIS